MSFLNGPEDAAAVLEQVIYNVSNLPSEIGHLYQEIEANDRTIQTLRVANSELDTSIQKSVKSNGVAIKVAREDAASKTILDNYNKLLGLQDENISLSERAEMLLERHLRRLDKKIQDLQGDGLMPVDHQLPTLLADSPGNLAPLPGDRDHSVQTLQPNQTAKPNGPRNTRSSSRPTPLTLQAQTTINNAIASASTPRQRENSILDTKRRRAVTAQAGSVGRQSSLGPGGSGSGTPKTSAPSSRSGSVAPGARATKKTPGFKKLGAQGTDKVWSPAVGGTPGQSGPGGARRKSSNKPTGTPGPSTPANGKITIRRGGLSKASPSAPVSNPAGDDDSFMSDLEGSDEDDSNLLDPRSGNHRLVGVDESDRIDPDDDEGDDTKYCLCQNVSYGDMVMCDNANCRYQWFHWACIGMDKEPEGDWLCPVCVKLSPGKVQKAQ